MTSLTEEKLKACPFCGASSARLAHIEEFYFVTCDFCGNRGIKTDDCDDAVSEWNRRAPSEENKRLKKALEEIRDQDVTEIALDPDWPSRIARAALTEDPEQPDGDGWIAWGGGECPIDKDALVTHKMRDGDIYTRRAVALRWSHEGWEGDIISYRVVSP